MFLIVVRLLSLTVRAHAQKTTRIDGNLQLQPLQIVGKPLIHFIHLFHK